MPHRIAPPILFSVLPKRERAVHGVREKALMIQTCTTVQVWGNVFCENCCAGEELPAKSRAGCKFFPPLYAVAIKHHISGCKRTHAATLSAAAGTHLQKLILPLLYLRISQRLAKRKARKAMLNQVQFSTPIFNRISKCDYAFFTR